MPHQYRKRQGTGIRGQLYETKLLSLIYFRAIHDNNVKDFHLATNVDKLGSFDDICFRAKFKDNDKPIAVFLQAKHKENHNSVFTLNKTELAEYFNSYLKVRRKFSTENNDVLFKGTFNETECLFVLYTTAKGDKFSSTYEGSFADHLNALIGTGEPGSKFNFHTNHEELCEIVMEEQMTALARPMAKCIFGEFNDIQMLMLDELVLRYHVILAQHFFEVSHHQSDKLRDARFPTNFFDINDRYLRLFKDQLCTEILKRRNPVDLPSNLHHEFLDIENHIVTRDNIEELCNKFSKYCIFKNGKFKLVNKNAAPLTAAHHRLLNILNDSPEAIRIALEEIVMPCLPTTFKVPAFFGNKDLAIRGNDKKIERKLIDLTSKIVGLIEQSKPSNIVTIDESLGGFLKLNGGITSAVGNLLIFDDNGYLKFNSNYDSLGNIGKKLFDKLNVTITNLHQYKFNVTVKIFPKLTFTSDEHSKTIVKDFLSKLVLFTSQSREEQVEDTLIYEVTNSQDDELEHAEVTSNAIYLKYHDEIQKWSMTSKVGTYLGKAGDLYKKSVKYAIGRPLLGLIHMMHKIKTKNYTLSEEAMNSIKLDKLPSGSIIVTENCAFTVAKLTNKLNNQNWAVLDLEYVLDLSPRDAKSLRKELTTDELKTIIVVYDRALITANSNNKIKSIADSIKEKTVIIIADLNCVENAKNHFNTTEVAIKDERNRLIDMSVESQEYMLEKTKVIFQGVEVGLGEVLDNDTLEYVGGGVLYEMIHGNKKCIGKPINKSNYKPKTYIERTVRQLKLGFSGKDSAETKRLRTLNDVVFHNHGHVVLIIGDPGVGKSTLLTHLFLKTKENFPKEGWILRINLLEYSNEFSEWKKRQTNIDNLDIIKFLCKVALSDESSKKMDLTITLEESEGAVQMKECSDDEWTAFELNMFLNYYNRGQKLIILFDGYDEICPIYANEALMLITRVKKCQGAKIWITSRSNGKINCELEKHCDILCELNPFNESDQLLYLHSFWDEQEVLKDLNDDQIKNLYGFIKFMAGEEVKKAIQRSFFPYGPKNQVPFLLVFFSLIKYLKDNLRSAPTFVMKDLGEVYRHSMTDKISDAIPLHLNIIANYLYNKIIDINTEPTQWDLITDIYYMYEDFMVTKLKRIRFQDKTKNDMSKPANISTYEREYADFKDTHKKLAAYAVYGKRLFNEDESKQVENMIGKLKEEDWQAEVLSTGIICKVVNDVPIFVHSMFADYFAVEYICDLLKREANPIFLWDFILNDMFFNCNLNLLGTLEVKIKNDTDMRTLFENNKNIIFDFLMKQGRNTKHRSALSEAIENDLRNIGLLLLSTIQDLLDESNVVKFIKIVNETSMLLRAAYNEFGPAIINLVRRVDESKLPLLFENIYMGGLVLNESTTDELISELQFDILNHW